MAALVEIATYLCGILLVGFSIKYADNAAGQQHLFNNLSFAMLSLQAAAFAVFLFFQIVKAAQVVHTLATRKLWAKVENAKRALRSHPEYAERVLARKYANRWSNRALHRPIPGWPKLGDVNRDEVALVLAALEDYYLGPPTTKEVLLGNLGDTGLNENIEGIARSCLPADFDLETFVEGHGGMAALRVQLDKLEQKMRLGGQHGIASSLHPRDGGMRYYVGSFFKEVWAVLSGGDASLSAPSTSKTLSGYMEPEASKVLTSHAVAIQMDASDELPIERCTSPLEWNPAFNKEP